MENSLKNYAVLWDMDGVLVDTGDLHYLTWQKAFEEVGYNFTREDFIDTFGRNNESIMKILFGEDVDPVFSVRVSERKEALFRQMLNGRVTLLPGVREWLSRFQAWGMRQAVASSAPAENIIAIADEFELRSYFNALVSGTGMPGKPHPDVFLKSAQELDVPPERCVVVEDAVHGVEGARAAGMKCIAVTTTKSAEALGQADLVLKDLTELNEEMVHALFF
ncbi:MAG: HAD-IA family hydrolase [Anaerolineales bacterium]